MARRKASKKPDRSSDLSPPLFSREVKPGEEIFPWMTLNRMRAFVALNFLAGAGVVAYNQCNKPDEAYRPESGEIAIRPFDPRTYQPPVEGRVWKQSEQIDSGKKTIVYIPDVHGLPDDPTTWPVQQEEFAIVESGLKHYGKAALVIEDWTDFGNPEMTYRMNTAQNFLEEMAAEKDRTKRRDSALEMLHTGRSRAPDLLPTVYQKELTPIPSHNTEMDIQTTAAVNMLHAMVKAHSKNLICRDFGADSTMGVDDAMRLVFSEAPPKEAIHCYCAYDGLFEAARLGLSHLRERVAAAEEIRRALTHQAPLVYVIAGTHHAPEAIRKMQESGANYFVVVPRSNPMNLSTVNDDYPKLPVCERWMEENRALMTQAIQALRARFRADAEKEINEMNAAYR